MSQVRLKLVRHTGEVVDVTRWVVRLKWTHSVSQPWEEIDATLALPYALLGTSADPLSLSPPSKSPAANIGDWLVVTTFDEDEDTGRQAERVIIFGHVDLTENMGLMADSSGKGRSHRTRILATSWLWLLRRQRLYWQAIRTTALGGAQSPGAIIRKVIGNMLKSFGTQGDQGMGAILAAMFRELANIKVPPGLAGGDASLVNRHFMEWVTVYSDERLSPSVGARRWQDFTLPNFTLPNGMVWKGIIRQEDRNLHQRTTYRDEFPRTAEPVYGPNLKAIQSFIGSSPSLLELLMATFQPDSGMVELFPDLMRPPGESLDRNTGSIMGNVAPVLVYRMVPFRTRSLLDFIADHRDKNDANHGSKSSKEVDKILAGKFTDETWNLESKGGVHIMPGQIFNLTMAQSDGNRVNAVTVHNPLGSGNPWRLLESMGMPIADEGAVNLHGLRLYEPNWNFLPPPGDAKLTPWMQIIAAQAAQYHMGSEVFARGTIDCQFMFDRLHGGGLIRDPGSDKPRPSPGHRLRHGGVIHAHVAPGRVLTAYVDSYHHLLQADGDGKLHGSTHINYSRGLYDEALREPASRLDFTIQELADPKEDDGASPMWVDRPGRIWVNGELRPIQHDLVKSGVEYLRLKWGSVEESDALMATGDRKASDWEEEVRVLGVSLGMQQIKPALLPKSYWSGAGKRYPVRAFDDVRDPRGGSWYGHIRWIVLHFTDGALKHGEDAEGPTRGIKAALEDHHINAQFYIGYDGTIYQTADARHAGFATSKYHAGASSEPTVGQLDGRAIHIELETPRMPFTTSHSHYDAAADIADNPDDPNYSLRHPAGPVLIQRHDSTKKDGDGYYYEFMESTGWGQQNPLSLTEEQEKALAALVASLHVNITAVASNTNNLRRVKDDSGATVERKAVSWLADEVRAASQTLSRDGKPTYQGLLVPRQADPSDSVLVAGGDLDGHVVEAFNHRTIPLSNPLAATYAEIGIPDPSYNGIPISGPVLRLKAAGGNEDVVDHMEDQSVPVDAKAITRRAIKRFKLVKAKDDKGRLRTYVEGLTLDRDIVLGDGGLCHHGNLNPARWDAAGVSINGIIDAARSIATNMTSAKNISVTYVPSGTRIEDIQAAAIRLDAMYVPLKLEKL